MNTTRERLSRARLDAASIETWVEAGWIAPSAADPSRDLSALDLARACLIRDLRDDLGVNDEGIAVVLDLLDQVHGLRRAIVCLASAVHALPEPLRAEARAALRAAAAGPRGMDEPPPGVAR